MYNKLISENGPELGEDKPGALREHPRNLDSRLRSVLNVAIQCNFGNYTLIHGVAYSGVLFGAWQHHGK